MLAERASIAKFGRVSRFGNTYTYTGRRLDEKTGLHYYRYRYYEARMGRFVGRDPLEHPQCNLYGMVFNRVMSGKDPSGLEYKQVEVGGVSSVGKVVKTPQGLSTGLYGDDYLNISRNPKGRCKQVCSNTYGTKADPKATGEVRYEMALVDTGEEYWTVDDDDSYTTDYLLFATETFVISVKKWRKYHWYKVRLREWDCNCCANGLLDYVYWEYVDHEDLGIHGVLVDKWKQESDVEVDINEKEIIKAVKALAAKK